MSQEKGKNLCDATRRIAAAKVALMKAKRNEATPDQLNALTQKVKAEESEWTRIFVN